jgi:hypothetical protein
VNFGLWQSLWSSARQTENPAFWYCPGEELAAMKGEIREKWRHLCAQAAEKQDPGEQ